MSAHLIAELNGHEFYIPTSGGKAGKGHQKTGTIQIRKDGFIRKQIRFVMGDEASQSAAIEKAKAFVADCCCHGIHGCTGGSTCTSDHK